MHLRTNSNDNADAIASEAEPSVVAQHSIADEDENLRATDAALTDIMRQLNSDRFSEGSGNALRNLLHQRGNHQFIVHSLLAFWHLHRNQLHQSQSHFDAIIADKSAPSVVAVQMTTFWRSVIKSMRKQDKMTGNSRLVEEREAFSNLRRSLTLGEPSGKRLWEDLFRTEGMWLITQLPDHNNKGNKKCQYVPGLLANEYHSKSLFPEVQKLEENYHKIMQEMEPFLAESHFTDVGQHTSVTDSNMVEQGKWSDVQLFGAGTRNDYHCRKLPMLCLLLEEEFPEVTRNVMGHALLSRLSPGTVIKRHHGVSNCQLTMHFGLRIPPRGAGIEVNGKERNWEAGKVLVLDDSFYHSVWHKGTDSDGPRLVLLLRGYHPEWTLEERRGMILSHNETPWTKEQRWAEVEYLSTPAAKARWKTRKKMFQHGPPSMSSPQDL